MCGRFVQYRLFENFRQAFELDPPAVETLPSYNVAPGQEVLAVVWHEGGNRLEKLRWGLVPFWAKDVRVGYKMINARAETVARKPAFRKALADSRCLIVADGFFEWKGAKGRKQPYYFTLPSGEPFAFAGLREAWKDKRDRAAAVYKSCAIITTEASRPVRDVHDRMPVILGRAYYGQWLDPENRDPRALTRILREGCMRELTFYRVSTYVNSAKNSDPACIEPEPEVQGEL